MSDPAHPIADEFAADVRQVCGQLRRGLAAVWQKALDAVAATNAAATPQEVRELARVLSCRNSDAQTTDLKKAQEGLQKLLKALGGLNAFLHHRIFASEQTEE